MPAQEGRRLCWVSGGLPGGAQEAGQRKGFKSQKALGVQRAGRGLVRLKHELGGCAGGGQDWVSGMVERAMPRKSQE
jgi:hypothetical protein